MSKKKLSRRDFLRMSALAGTSSILAACSTATEEPKEVMEPEEDEISEAPPPEEGKTIQYWVGWGGTYAGETWDALQETEEFKEFTGKDTFEIKGSVPYEGFLTALAAGTPPDGASNIQYLDYMARDVLLPLEPYAETSEIVNPEAFIEGSWQQSFYKNRMLGVPANECFLRFGMNYNTRMVKSAGLDPENPPETWNEWFVWHEALTKFDSAGNLLQIGLDPTDAMGEGLWDSDGWMVQSSYGWDWFDEQSGAFNLKSQELEASLDMMKKYVDLIGVDNLASMRSVEGQGSWGGSFNAEVQAMIIEGYWHPGETASEKPEVAAFNKATWLPVPESRKGVKTQGTGGHLVVIFKEFRQPRRHVQSFRIPEYPESGSNYL